MEDLEQPPGEQLRFRTCGDDLSDSPGMGHAPPFVALSASIGQAVGIVALDDVARV